MEWTKEKDDQLQRYINIGLSYSSIARRMGITKNAAMGRAYRLRQGKGTALRDRRANKPVTPSANPRAYTVRPDKKVHYTLEVGPKTPPILAEITRILNERQITVSEYAEIVGMTPEAFSRYKNGYSLPSLPMLEAMLNALGLTIWCKETVHPRAITNKKTLTNAG